MGRKGKAKGPFGFAEEFRKFSEEGRFSEAFFEKLAILARSRVARRHWSPWQLGLPSENWDEGALQELAMEFLTRHLAAEGRALLEYVLDKARNNEVDFLMVTIFDQFLAECAKAISPHGSKLRARIKRAMVRLVEDGKARAVLGRTDCWSPPAISSGEALELSDLNAQVKELPAFVRRTYRGEKRASPVISEKDLQRTLSSVFEAVTGIVHLDTLTEFLCRRLDVHDPAFHSIDVTEEEAEELGMQSSSKPASVMSEMGEADAWLHLKRALGRLTPRQRKIFELSHLRGHTVPEICAMIRAAKSVVYDELGKIEVLLRE